MLAPRLYVVKALTKTDKKDKHDRNIVDWVRVYSQVSSGAFEYTHDKEQATAGDFGNKISHCKATNMANKEERVIKLEEEKKGKKKEDPKTLEIKIDEDFPRDLHKLTNVIDEYNKGPSDLGRSLLMNSHSGRGVSALSRGMSHSNYRGIVTVLLILLIISNLKYILKQGADKGWVVGNTIVESITNPSHKFSWSGFGQVCI